MKKNELTFYDLFYIFIIGCAVGWIVEGFWSLIKKNLIINHSALVIGPFNIVYGIGAVALTIMLHKLKDASVIKIFFSSFITGSVLEYIMSFLMEYFLGFVAWNYQYKPFNLNGRICLSYSIFWGILGIFWIKIVYPKIKKLLNKCDKKTGLIFMKILIIFLSIDILLTIGAIIRGKNYEKNIPPANQIEIYLDKYFGVDYLNNMFNNRWNKK